MHDFFYKSDYALFSDQTIIQLRNYAIENSIMFYKNGNNSTGVYDGNYIMMFPPTANADINVLVNNSLFSAITLMIKHPPGQSVVKHVDGVDFNRATVLNIPLTLGKHTNTVFWESYNDNLPIAELSYETSLPVVLNTTKIHSLENNTENTRLTFQFEFSQPFQEIVFHLKNKTLFKSY
jgi:hypothetical protein